MSHLTQLATRFYPTLEQLGEFTPIEGESLPAPFQGLLDHDDHMTVTIEAFHNSLVDVKVLQEIKTPTDYARKSLLARRTDGKNVQLGLMHLCLERLPETAQADLLRGDIPLGRILIRHHVLRHVQLSQLWQIIPSKELQRYLELPADLPTYGRTARIIVAGKPAIELLEIPLP